MIHIYTNKFYIQTPNLPHEWYILTARNWGGILVGPSVLLRQTVRGTLYFVFIVQRLKICVNVALDLDLLTHIFHLLLVSGEFDSSDVSTGCEADLQELSTLYICLLFHYRPILFLFIF